MEEFFFIRHGETDWNREGRWQGTIDTDLNETGRTQAQAAVPALLDRGISRIITSPLKRCLQTTEIINYALMLPVHQDKDLRERTFGRLNGGKVGEIGDIEQQDHEANGIEYFSTVVRRATRTIESSLVRYPDQRILFVSHGGVFRAIHSHFCGEDMKSANAVPYHFVRENGIWTAQAVA
ncbi:MAG: histidine phosphatase family protein [Alphaproteobacteria bacterium]|nr:histidine phosphatase family protein [Alphaproteobacteria bacterium]